MSASVSARGTLLPLLQTAGVMVHEIIITPQVSEAELAHVLAAASAAPQIIFQSYNATRFARQAELIAHIAPEKLILIAGRNPYDLALSPQAKTRIAAYSNRPAALQQLFIKLMGI